MRYKRPPIRYHILCCSTLLLVFDTIIAMGIDKTRQNPINVPLRSIHTVKQQPIIHTRTNNSNTQKKISLHIQHLLQEKYIFKKKAKQKRHSSSSRALEPYTKQTTPSTIAPLRKSTLSLTNVLVVHRVEKRSLTAKL